MTTRTKPSSKRYQVRTYSMGGFPISEESFDALADYVRSGKETGMPVFIVDEKPKKPKRGKR